MACHIVKLIGMTCSQQSVSLAASRWKQATGGSRRSTITTTVSASTARSAKRTSRDKVSSPREVDHFVRRTPAKSPQQLMYNSDTVYSTTTFRPVSPSPITLPLNTPSPQRTRKLETPLHFDGGLFSDIRSTDGKLLSKVTVDRVQSSTRHDITDSPSMNVDINPKENKYVDDIIKTETITNKEFVTVKFTPVPLELDTPRMLTPSEMYDRQQKNLSPVEYIKDNFEDLESYKIVSSVCKEKLFENNLMLPEISLSGSLLDKPNVSEPVRKGSSPLANLLISEQLTKIDNYMQESLEVCTGVRNSFTPSPVFIGNDIKTAPIINDNNISQKEDQIVQKVIHVEQSHNIHRTHHEIMEEKADYLSEILADKTSSNDIFTKDRKEEVRNNESIKQSPSLYHEGNKDIPKINSVNEKRPGVLSAIYKMPTHYHAAIMCFLLIIYNLVYQYIKQNCYGKKNN